MRSDEVLRELRSMADPESVKGMAQYGIRSEDALGISVPQLRSIAKSIGKNHSLAQELWESGVHEARMLAAMVDEPAEVTEEQMESWVRSIDSWDICDICCSSLFDKTRFAWKKALDWPGRKEEFVKRSGFSLMAALAVHDKKATDDLFIKFLPVIERESTDERNYVKKAVNWALRQIGKRNMALNLAAIESAKRIRDIDSKSARWIASDALRELTSESVQERLRARQSHIRR
ncbi:MAG: DNA alkylation repair protein [Methanomassiliicoccales archaeon]|nr:DNA alkylation repair protein [Methanomassiliicoccales archaeon]